MQDLIDNDTITIDGPPNNEDHMAFKQPFYKHDKGESSNNKKQSANNLNFAPPYDHIVNAIIVNEQPRKEASNAITRG